MQTMFCIIPCSTCRKYWYLSFEDEDIEPQSDYVTWLNSNNLQMAELEIEPREFDFSVKLLTSTWYSLS